MDGITLKTGQSMGSRIDGSFSSQGLMQAPKSSEPAVSFADTLTQAIGKVNTLHQESDKGMQNLATGKSENIADVMIAAEKADIALKVMVQVRNKIIDAYQEMMRMQV